MAGVYIYLIGAIIAFFYLGYKIYLKRKQEKDALAEREDNVFYDAVKDVRRD